MRKLTSDQPESSSDSDERKPLFRSWIDVVRSILFAAVNFGLAIGVVYLLVGSERWGQLDRSGLYVAIGFMAILFESGPLSLRPPATCQPMALRIAGWIAGLFIIVVAGTVIALTYPQWLTGVRI